MDALVIPLMSLAMAAGVIGVAILQRRLKDARRALKERDDRMAAVTHELRGPLQPIALATAKLRRDPSLSPKARDAVDVIDRNVEAQTRLIEDLWEVMRGERAMSVRVEPTDLNGVVTEVVESLLARAEAKGVALETRLDPIEPAAYADPVRLRQIVRNLVDNALKFTPGGGTVVARTDHGGGHDVAITVADTGVGIPADQLDRVFDPYAQLHPGAAGGGIGLGLYVARRLAEAQSGTLTVQSAGPGLGSAFRLTLPLAPVAANPAGGALRVLLVEDHEDSARLIDDLLRGHGFDVRAVGTVDAALTAAARETFDVLVSDIELPDGSGLDLLRRLAAFHPMRGVALSGRASEADLAASRAAGFAVHLLKPLDIDALVAAIEGCQNPGEAPSSRQV